MSAFVPMIALPKVSGNAQTLRDTAASWQHSATAGRTGASALRRHVGAVNTVWTGAASDNAQVSLEDVAVDLETAGNKLDTGAIALTVFAAALEYAKTQLAMLDGTAKETISEYHRKLADINETLGSNALLGDKPRQELWEETQATLRRILTRAQQVVKDLRTAGTRCRSVLDETWVGLEFPGGPWHVRWEKNTSLEDYITANQAAILSRLVPGLGWHQDSVEAAVWAVKSGVPAVKALTFDVLRMRSNLTDYYRLVAEGKHDGAVSALTKGGKFKEDGKKAFRAITKGIGKWGDWLTKWFPGMKLFSSQNMAKVENYVLGTGGNAWHNGKKVFNEALDGGASKWSAVNKAFKAGSKTLGFFKRANAISSAAGTVGSAVNIASQGWPWDAYKKNGASYIADWAELGFNGASTAFLVCPTPWTAGAALATGVIWGATELYAHREDVKKLFTDGAEVVGDAWDAATDAVNDAANKAAKKVNDVVDDLGQAAGNIAQNTKKTAGKVASWLNPFD